MMLLPTMETHTYKFDKQGTSLHYVSLELHEEILTPPTRCFPLGVYIISFIIFLNKNYLFFYTHIYFLFILLIYIYIFKKYY